MLSGKVLDGGPCTPFDPAPLGLALHEAQREELVSTPEAHCRCQQEGLH